MKDTVTVREAMTRTFVGVSESDSVSETARLLADEDADSALVLRGEEPVGQLRASDLLGALAGDDAETTQVGDVMADPPPSLAPDATVSEAALALSGDHDWRAVIADGDGALGTVDARDVLAAGVGRTAERGVERRVERAADTPAGAEDRSTEPEEFDDQSICEGCGSLSRTLSRFNGQLLCADCREV